MESNIQISKYGLHYLIVHIFTNIYFYKNSSQFISDKNSFKRGIFYKFRAMVPLINAT